MAEVFNSLLTQNTIQDKRQSWVNLQGQQEQPYAKESPAMTQ